ncbi:MAG TPA: Imm10 family immunity protein [Thermoguttaceae bacterium]|nr:Imm10 family immunity protein [Thermoguttaceae bacterium]
MDTQYAELGAGFVYTQNDGEIAMVGFADQQYDTKAYVLLQRTLRPSGDDVRRGWDDVHVTVNDQTRSAYGGVKRITLRNKQVLIKVSPTTANHLGTGETISVNMENAQVDIGKLAEMLKLVCRNHAEFSQAD